MFDLIPFDRRRRGMIFNPFSDFDNFEKAFFQHTGIDEFKADIKDLGDSYQLEADLPGFKKEDINVSLDGDCLTIGAQRSTESEETDSKGNFIRRERSYGAFTRCFDVSGIQHDAIRAEYTNGVLKLTMPKKANTLPASRTIAIES
ncbi:MAG: Hsp20/alpha crystallin family protein [Oscillospiraceae bacterium]|jgi:HSP20 family protein|nr:Hsp20/alpha crystallin family protein [Oscillospiraceae bacterium]